MNVEHRIEFSDSTRGENVLDWHNDYQIIKKDSTIKLNSVALVRKRTISTERPPLVGEVRANFCG
jgi:hypothetical protein